MSSKLIAELVAYSRSYLGFPHPAPQRALGGRAGLFGSLVCRAAEQHQRADELVVTLLGPAAKELDLLPFVGRLDAPSASLAVPIRGSPSPCCAVALSPKAAGTEGCHTAVFAASRGSLNEPDRGDPLPTAQVLL
jgi:hypothetical protein